MTAHPVTMSAVAVVLLAGCGIPNPTAETTPRRQTVAEGPHGLRVPADVVRERRDPLVRVAVEYVLTQATWSADTYVDQQARLARLSTGSALAQLAPRDGQSPAAVAATLAAAGSSSRATVIATDGPNSRHQVIVAYKTHATGSAHQQGRPDYQIAHVTLTRRRGRWLVDRFAIQP
jgi:hypothetical protein